MENTHFEMYYQLQYDRIDKLETRRENFSNFIITLSIGLNVLSYSDLLIMNDKLTRIYLILLFFLNLYAILFHLKTRKFIKMHQDRADLLLEKYSPEIFVLKNSIKKPESDKDPFSRYKIYIYLHILLFVFALGSCCIDKKPEKKASIECCCKAS